jgi:hypothetical protein
MTHAAEIVAHYRARGLAGLELQVAVRRHVRLLSVLDLPAALELDRMPLGRLPERERVAMAQRRRRFG